MISIIFLIFIFFSSLIIYSIAGLRRAKCIYYAILLITFNILSITSFFTIILFYFDSLPTVIFSYKEVI
jgi:hypothetical protein